MKIEVGKSYWTKDGDKVIILAADPCDKIYPYIGSNDRWYTSNGTYYYGGDESNYDLVDDGSSEPSSNKSPLLMKFDPVDGSEKPYPSEASQYREYHGQVAWLYNPYTGEKRDSRDIGTDVFGLAISK